MLVSPEPASIMMEDLTALIDPDPGLSWQSYLARCAALEMQSACYRRGGARPLRGSGVLCCVGAAVQEGPSRRHGDAPDLRSRGRSTDWWEP